MTIKVSRNKREKFGRIVISWWENIHFQPYNNGRDFIYWWLDEVISFKAGDDPIKIPIEGTDIGGGDDSKVIVSELRRTTPSIRHVPSSVKNFPRKGDLRLHSGNDFQMVLFGEDDNNNISQDEFYNAGGSANVEWDVDTYSYQINFQPPLEKIGVNENFSITLEGSVPSIFLRYPGSFLIKRTSTFYTEFYGKTNSVLEVELPHITEKRHLYNSAQRLLEKYSYGNTTISAEYYDKLPIVDNKSLVPQSVVVDSLGRRSTTNAFIYNRLDSIPQKPLSELGSSEHTLDDVQFYPLAFLS